MARRTDGRTDGQRGMHGSKRFFNKNITSKVACIDTSVKAAKSVVGTVDVGLTDAPAIRRLSVTTFDIR